MLPTTWAEQQHICSLTLVFVNSSVTMSFKGLGHPDAPSSVYHTDGVTLIHGGQIGLGIGGGLYCVGGTLPLPIFQMTANFERL